MQMFTTYLCDLLLKHNFCAAAERAVKATLDYRDICRRAVKDAAKSKKYLLTNLFGKVLKLTFSHFAGILLNVQHRYFLFKEA